MTLNHIKEQLSDRFLGILAASQGFSAEKPQMDYGIDCVLRKGSQYNVPGGEIRHTFDPNVINVQLKSTTESSIVYEPALIRYVMEAKTYNDLVYHRTNSFTRFILVLFILPDLETDWVSVTADDMTIRKHAFWYEPDIAAVQTVNTSSITVEIPIANRLDINSCNSLHSLFYP